MATLIQSMQNILSQKDPSLAFETKRIILKKFLQAYTLDFLYNHPSYKKLKFYGGTCLHLLYGLNRLSEDIDLDNSNEISLQNLQDDLLNFYRTNVGYNSITAGTQIGEKGIQGITLKFPVLFDLGLTRHADESLNLKVEISQHKQLAIIKKTPVLVFGRSFVAAHFSLETMMAGKMLACLERNFQKGKSSVAVKGRDFYDLLWFMQRNVQPMEEKLAEDGNRSYSVHSAMELLAEKIDGLKASDLAVDLLPLFEERPFIEAWLESFKQNFFEYRKNYL